MGIFDEGGLLGKGGTGSDLLSAVPYAGMAVGALQSLFGESEADKRKKRIDNLLKQNEMRRTQSLQRIAQLKQGGIKDISGNTATQLGRAQSDIARRATASGRTGDTESMMLPVTSNINEAGGKNMENALQFYDTQTVNTQNQFDQNAANIEGDAASQPLESNWGTDLMNVGAQYFQYQNQNKAMENQQDYNDRYLKMLNGQKPANLYQTENLGSNVNRNWVF
ncbi:MAG: hypothetical protein IMZ53_10025 [Thermoplasmata archaeon]|nr:hypothetical protein [Thermoplasmata archaeon]